MCSCRDGNGVAVTLDWKLNMGSMMSSRLGASDSDSQSSSMFSS
jgi:hypothetical protein